MKTLLLCLVLILTTGLKAQESIKNNGPTISKIISDLEHKNDSLTKVKSSYSKRRPAKAKNDSLLTLNFKTMKLEGYEDFNPQKDRLYNLKVTNINMNLYKVIINKKDTIVTTPVDFSSFSMLDPSGLASLTSSIIHTTTLKTGIQERQSLITKEMSNISFDLTNNKSKSFHDEKLSKNLEDLKEYYSALQELRDYDSILSSKAKTISDATKKFSEYYNNIVSRFDRDNLSNVNNSMSYDLINSFEDKVTRFRDTLSLLVNEYNKKVDEFKEFVKNKKVAIKQQELNGTAARIQTKIDDTQSEIKKIQAKVSPENIKIVIEKFIDIVNNSLRTYTSLPLQFNGDKSRLKVSFVPQDKDSKLPSFHEEYLLPYSRNFYMGIGPGIYCSGLYDERFSTLEYPVTDSTTNYQRISEKGSKYEVGLSVLLKAGWKLRNYNRIGFHGALGGGLSFTNPLKLRVLYGGGISIGNKHCLTVDFLLSTGYVNVLSNAASNQSTFAEKPDSFTVSVLKTKPAFSIGYVFTF